MCGVSLPVNSAAKPRLTYRLLSLMYAKTEAANHES